MQQEKTNLDDLKSKILLSFSTIKRKDINFAYQLYDIIIHQKKQEIENISPSPHSTSEGAKIYVCVRKRPLNMNEKLNTIDKSIKKINNLMDRTNYDINKLYDKNQNYEKLMTNLKNNISKAQKYISESRSKNKKSKEKDNDKNKDRSKNKNRMKERRLGSTHEMNKIKY